jgi:hypothetical protein
MCAMKWLALTLLALLQCSCITSQDNRALYQPDPLGGYGGPQYIGETMRAPLRSMPPATPPLEPERAPATTRPEFRY